MSDEGSVIVDGIDVDSEESDSQDTTNDQGTKGQTDQDQDENTENGENQDQENKDDPAHSKDGDVKLTEKGTKLDPNPQSAVHQELANAKRVMDSWKRVLTDPVSFYKYAEEAGFKQGDTKAKTEVENAMPKIDPSKIQTAEDLAGVLNSLQETFNGKIAGYEKTITDLQKSLQGLSETSKSQLLEGNMKSDISRVRTQYPELDPKSTSYNAELEKDLADLYHELDFDEESGGYRGKVSIARLAEKVMKAAGKARKQGSEEAQTIIKDKSSGKVVTSSKKTENINANENADPGAQIASRINKLFKK